MPKYALRYVPLLILALFLIPLRLYTLGNAQQNPNLAYKPASPFSAGSVLYSVTMLSSGDGWAVGGSFFSLPSMHDVRDAARQLVKPSSGMILHYTGNVWVAANVADPLPLPLFSVSLDSPQDGWAVGYTGTFVHYDGHVWSTVPAPANFNKNLLGVAVLSPSNGWAVGYSGSILHYDGKQWTQVQSPTTLDLRSIAMLSSQEGWAVGDSGTILHYHDGTWSLINPSPTSNTLNSISMLSTNEGWAVGKQDTILHFRDGIWERVYPANYYRDSSSYQPIDLFGVAMNSIRSGWIIGDQHFLTYSSEAWIEPDSFSSIRAKHPEMKFIPRLYGIAMAPSGEAWAVGSTDSYSSNTIVILHYQHDTWDIYS